jgi:hypothetical protein
MIIFWVKNADAVIFCQLTQILSGPVQTSNINNPQFCEIVATKESNLRVTKFFPFLLLLNRDPGSEIRVPGWIKIRTRDKYPGSATLMNIVFTGTEHNLVNVIHCGTQFIKCYLRYLL